MDKRHLFGAATVAMCLAMSSTAIVSGAQTEESAKLSSGSVPTTKDVTSIKSLENYPIPPCSSTINGKNTIVIPDKSLDNSGKLISNIAVFHVVIPQSIGNGNIGRMVKFKNKHFDPESTSESNGSTNSDFHDDKKKGPFHINLKDWREKNPSVTSGYILVRVVLRSNSTQWGFYDDDVSEGHGPALMLGAQHGLSDAVCGYSKLDDMDDEDALRVRRFYIDVAKFDWTTLSYAVPFNIILHRKKWAETPIIIDPKIRNDG